MKGVLSPRMFMSRTCAPLPLLGVRVMGDPGMGKKYVEDEGGSALQALPYSSPLDNCGGGCGPTTREGGHWA